MRYYILFLITCCLTSISIQGQSTKKDSTNTKEESIPVIPNDCCCKDTDPCFEKDRNYNKKPLDVSKDIILDFRAKAFGIPKMLNLKKGDFIRVRVVNYNPFVYKVNIDNRDSSVTQPIDAGFLGMFLSPDKFSSAVAGLISTVGTPPISILPSKNKESVITVADKKGFLFKNGVNPKTPMDLKQLERDFLIVLTAQETVNVTLEKYIQYTDSKKGTIMTLRKNIEEKLYNIAAEFANLQQLYLDCNSFSELVIKTKADSYSDALKLYQAEARELSLDLYNNSRQFKFLLAPYKTIIDSNASFKIRYNFVDTFFRIASAEVNGLDTSINSKKISDIYASLLKLGQNTSCYTSLPIYIGNDIKVISIGLKPVDDKSNLPSYQTSLSIPDYQKRIWGVSGGIFLTGLHNDIYTNRRKENDTTYNLVPDKQSKVQIGVNALAYTAWKVTPASPNYLGVCFGAGMSLESKPKPRILIGMSFITGEKNRIGFSAGLTGGFVSQLSDAFSTTANYVKPAENYQKDIMKLNGFFSLNYSFISK